MNRRLKRLRQRGGQGLGLMIPVEAPGTLNQVLVNIKVINSMSRGRQ